MMKNISTETEEVNSSNQTFKTFFPTLFNLKRNILAKELQEIHRPRHILTNECKINE